MQGGQVFQDLTVKENLEMGALNMTRRERSERIVEMLSLFPNISILPVI